MFSNDGVKNIDNSYTSRVAEIFNVVLKSLGIGIDFLDEDEKVRILNDEYVSQHTLKGKTYFCTDYQFFLIERIDSIRDEILSVNPVLTESKLQEMIEQEMKDRCYINGPLNEDLDDLEIKVMEEIAQEVVKQKEERDKLKQQESENLPENNGENDDKND